MNSKFWKNLKKDLSILTAIVGIAVPIFCFYIFLIFLDDEEPDWKENFDDAVEKLKSFVY